MPPGNDDVNQPTLTSVIDEWRSKLLLISEDKSTQVVGSKWNRKQLLGHLIDSAANNHQRFIRLQQGDLSGFPGYDQEHWVERGCYSQNSWANLIQLWHLYNHQLALIIEHIDAKRLRAKWMDKNVDLKFLIDDYVAHMRHHLAKL